MLIKVILESFYFRIFGKNRILKIIVETMAPIFNRQRCQTFKIEFLTRRQEAWL